MDINAAFPSNYLKCSDLQNQEVMVTIQRIEMEDIGGDHKPVLYFLGKERGLVLNKTNANAIVQLHSPETDHWIGKKIVLFPTQTDFQGKIVPCIRVKLTAPEQPPAQPQAPPAQQQAPQQQGGQDYIPF